ncbi:AMP-binding protein [Halomonas sp. HAL1]|uniref:AMP-binding protein n=1 Tax=Halomonas sp. HAL1 TaxID=550984 RepID=UPI00022D3396|nr:AMP-binding protein [Halomonas sp. HAL1]EHA16377.1 acyl-CoA synthetase [Halomonas sp. HAL1]WKV94188.1 AMP-binding protein [Halomonas sp. HAL1]
MVNLSAFIAFHARQRPEHTAIIYGEERVSYNAFDQRIRRLAALLKQRGIGEDDIVAVFMKNSPAFLEVAFATSYLGAVFLPVNFRLAANELAHILKDAGAKLLFIDEELTSVCEIDQHVVVVDTMSQHDSRRLSSPDLPLPDAVPRRSDQLFRLMYTSGTTARPKGVMHSYENFYWKCMDHVIALNLTAEDKLLTVGPLYHVGAFDLPGVAVLWRGGTICLQREFIAEDALASIEQHQLSCAWTAPVMLNQILSFESPERFDLSSLRWCIGGGEKTPESRIRDFTRVFTSARYIDGYGLTESCSGDTLMPPGMEIEKIGSTGRALAHVEIRICDEQGHPLPPNTDGEICLCGPKVTRGYWNDPVKTAESFFGEWFRTGDIGHLDGDGFLFVTDRRKDMILTGAENVASSEVENVIYLLPQVAEAAVVGLPDEQWGERLVAVVVLREGKTLSYSQLEQHCRGHLANFKVPKQLLISEGLPRNPSGKILKRELREMYARPSFVSSHPKQTG